MRELLLTPTEEDLIRETIGHYSDGIAAGDVEILKKVFHEQAILCGYLGDEMMAAPIQGLYDWVESNGAPEDYKCTILDIEIANRVGTAKIRETDSDHNVIDYFHLLKVGEQWWIVSKVWDSVPASK